jgi:WD40 repeat protein/HEAT repeat protein
MPITVTCACGKTYSVQEELAGQRVTCPDCGQALTVPGDDDLVPADAVTLDEPEIETVPPPQKKSSKKLLFSCLGCGCFLMLMGLGLGGAAVALVAYVGVEDAMNGDFSALNIDFGTGETDKDKDKAPDPNKDKVADLNRDKVNVPDKEKPPPDPLPKPNDNQPPLPEQGPWKGHLAGIKAISSTLDGKVVTAAGDLLADEGGQLNLAPDNSVRIWKAADGSEEKRLDVSAPIFTAAISPDGHTAAIVYSGVLKDGVWQPGSDNLIHLWDLQQGKELPSLSGHTDPINCLAFNKSGTRLVSGGKDRTVRVWDVRTGRQTFLLPGHLNSVTGVAFQPGGEYVASCSADRTVRLWDLDDDGKPKREFKGHNDIVWAVAFSPDGKQLVSGGGLQADKNGLVEAAKDYGIRLWNVEDGMEIKRFAGHTSAVSCLAFSSDGRRLISSGRDKTVRVWVVASGKELAKFDGHTDNVRAVAFLPGDRRALSGGDDKSLRLWDLPPDVPDIVRNLENPDVLVKLKAIAELNSFGDEAKPAIPALLKCLAINDNELRKEALKLLKKLGGGAGADQAQLLVQLAGDKSFPEGQSFALDALATLGPDAKPALPALIAMLTGDDATLRRKAIPVIAQIGPDARTTAYAPLVEMLRDPDAETAKAAGEALLKLGKPEKEQVEALGRFLSDGNDHVRKYALMALGELGADADPALEQIKTVLTRDRVADMRKLALTTMLKLKPKDQATLDLAVKALKDDNAAVALQAVAVLVEIGPANGALTGLLQALEHGNDDVRKAADEAFNKATFTKEQLPALKTALALNKNAQVRLQLVNAIAKLGPDGADAADDLGRLVRDATGELRLKAIAALADFGPAGKQAAPMLLDVVKNVNDKEPAARIEAAVALAKMNVPESKEAIPLLVRALLVTDGGDDKQRERQEKASKILLEIGAPAAEPLSRSLTGDFFSPEIKTPDGMAKAAARKKVMEMLIALGPKANTSQVLRDLVSVFQRDPDPALRKLADQARGDVQKKP